MGRGLCGEYGRFQLKGFAGYSQMSALKAE
jgi:hypothetical protein